MQFRVDPQEFVFVGQEGVHDVGIKGLAPLVHDDVVGLLVGKGILHRFELRASQTSASATSRAESGAISSEFCKQHAFLCFVDTLTTGYNYYNNAKGLEKN